MKDTNSQLTRAKWDTEFSTYFWQIHLDPNHSFNTAEMITGYSKVRNQSEAQDKEYLLKRKIAMLFNRGYFQRSTRIEIFARATQATIDKNRDPKILILYPQHYSIPEFNHDVIFKKFGPWLKAFYDRVNTGRSIADIIPAVKKGTNKDEFLKTENYNFKHVGQLYAHAARLGQHGHAPGAVADFIRKVKERNKWE